MIFSATTCCGSYFGRGGGERMCTKTRRGIHAGLTPECSNVNGVRRPCTVLGALENARGRGDHPPPSTPCFTYPAIARPAPPWGHSSRGQGSRNDGRSPLQADGPAPSSNVHQQTLIPASASFLGVWWNIVQPSKSLELGCGEAQNRGICHLRL